MSLRLEARLKPGYAWSYRVLDPAAWYRIDQSRSNTYAVAIETPDGLRVVDASHVDVRSLLD